MRTAAFCQDEWKTTDSLYAWASEDAEQELRLAHLLPRNSKNNSYHRFTVLGRRPISLQVVLAYLVV